MTQNSSSVSPAEPPAAPPAGTSVQELKKRAKTGSLWVTASYGLGQLLRLGSNLILTRFLAPELFGVVSLIQAFLMGLEMFSDVGVALSVVQNKSGDRDDFLDTAWSVQALRGGAIFVVACAISPLAGKFYEEPALPLLMVASAVGPLIKSFSSTSTFTAKRDLTLGRLTILELGAQALATVTAVTWAFLDPTAWALVAGAVVACVVNAVGSHYFLPRRAHRFRWDKDAARELIHFGAWIFVGSSFGFLANHADRLVVGKMFSMAELGTYAIASLLVRFVIQLYQHFNRSVLFPVFSATTREHPENMPSMVRRVRWKIFPIFTVPLIFLSVGADIVVSVMFDPRYADAGWMLQILAIAWVVDTCMETGPVLLSHGDSKFSTLIIGARAVVQFACMFLGGWWAGAQGLLWGLVASRLVGYGFRSYGNHRYKVWAPLLDLVMLGAAGVIYFLVWQLRLLLDPYIQTAIEMLPF